MLGTDGEGTYIHAAPLLRTRNISVQVRKRLNICRSVEYCFSFEFLNCISFGILPHRHPITVVVGRPVSVEKIPEPTPQQVGKVIEFKT